MNRGHLVDHLQGILADVALVQAGQDAADGLLFFDQEHGTAGIVDHFLGHRGRALPEALRPLGAPEHDQVAFFIPGFRQDLLGLITEPQAHLDVFFSSPVHQQFFPVAALDGNPLKPRRPLGIG